MKKNDGISKLLGLTQEQLAMLLGVTRSRISLYELGLRQLPTAANIRLTEILLIRQASATQSAKRQPAKTNEPDTLMFKALLNQNDSQQQRIAKKISGLQQKQSTGLKGQALLDLLATTTENKEKQAFLFMPPENRNASYIIKTGQSQILKHEIELKVLQYEAELLRGVVGEGS